MSRYLPHPLLSLSLVVMWLLLTRFSLGHLLLGSVIAIGAGWVVERVQPPKPRLRRWHLIPRLFFIVAYDILRSNIAVAKVVLLGPDNPRYHSGFIRLDLKLRDPNALAVLAIIVTSTPGTAWIEYNREEDWLLLHVLDVFSEDDWQALIHDRYEALLMEIFE
ncbi:Na+/H+ antiporter subunit E [Paracoccus sulfuroxidans]|uniref:Multisubunit potassium/proton antiporter, PhaE subunit (TC 2.A.63.1.1) n=1 Tax=Paracoccus sulfuroxidans TaxID=384678 RepID=A0A562P186_9RHOB|nr:Na+/H+ antiporter subunit E [Paracoccus sulfuroxidans]TWI38093.1 multisubunit potassium/proton antiporter, PhaE subunit (TC 2.A.63.1.1) [Paracoccus sulfuroxidans]